MSVPLKPISIDFNNRQLDAKQKKFHASIERALQHFDSVTEWADYIASLGKLLKALQSWTPQFQNVRYCVPFPYQVSRRLASSLSPNLPSGVHLKTIEVYSIIFNKIGVDTLSKECNIWVPGILPLMSYASISVKGPLIELYEQYLVQLPPSTLRLILKPLLASLMPDIDDESSESQPATLSLIETLRENAADEPLFWQSCFMIMINNKERRSGGLTWLTKFLPSLNAIPHKLRQRKEEELSEGATDDNLRNRRQSALKLLLPVAKDVVHPEPGLLIRFLVSCLADDSELLIKRGILDLLLQRINLSSPIIQYLASESDRTLLMMSCCRTMLTRDMSISRRIWNWLLGPNSLAGNTSDQAIGDEYFPRYGEASLLSGLTDMIKDEQQAPDAFKICLEIMDRWEIASHIIPKLFVPLMMAAFKFQKNDTVMKNASEFIDSVETHIICSHLFEATVVNNNLSLLSFVLSRFRIGNDEEIIVRHLPLILLAILCKQKSFGDDEFEAICEIVVSLTPERAYLPIEHSKIYTDSAFEGVDSCASVTEYYSGFLNATRTLSVEYSSDISPPYSAEDVTCLIFVRMRDCLLDFSNKGARFNRVVDLFLQLVDKIPQDLEDTSSAQVLESNKIEERQLDLSRPLTEKLFKLKADSNLGGNDSILGWVKLYAEYLAPKLCVMETAKLSKALVTGLWALLVNPDTQIESIKYLDQLDAAVGSKYVESALSFAFVEENDINSKVSALDAIWVHSENTASIARRSLELVLDELFDDQHPNYLSTSRWVSGVVKQGSANKLYHILCENLLNNKLIHKDTLDELDDIDSFVYYCQLLINVLNVERPIVQKSFKAEQTSVQSIDTWKGEDISNYKNLAIAIAIKFLGANENHNGKSVRTVLVLLDVLLDGTERNFQFIVTFLLELTNRHFNVGTQESELISVSLLHIISKVLKLSHSEHIELGIFDDDKSHLRYIDFLVTGVLNMRSPLIIHSYVKLLSESLVYFQNSIFSIILPLTTSITERIKKLFGNDAEKGLRYQSIAYLIGGLQELMEVSHSYLAAEESGGVSNTISSRNEFLQSMVANVFSNDTGGLESKLKHEREIVIQSFKLVVSCCLEIWTWAHQHSKSKENEGAGTEFKIFEDSLHHQAYKYKSQSKKLLVSVFVLEPLEVLEEFISEHPDNVSLTLIHALDGNKPALTIPYLLQSIVYRCNKFSTVTFSNTTTSKSAPGPLLMNQLNSRSILNFILEYLATLENAAVEDFYNDFVLFMKETSNNPHHYKKISSLLLKTMALVCDKVYNSRYGDEKKVKRELSDIFIKFLQSALAEDVNASDVSTYNDLDYLCSRLQSIVIDYPAGDKCTSAISTIVQSAIISCFKKQHENPIPPHVLKLLLTISEVGGKVKPFKTLINDIFFSDKKFGLLKLNSLWSAIIFQWSNYSENREKLVGDLVASIGVKGNAISPNINPFTAWSDSEIETKCHNIIRISYLLLISPQDHYLLQFKSLMNQLEQNLVSEEPKIQSCCFLLLRCVLLQFSAMHFAEHWSMLSYSLQTGLQKFYECLQMQQNTEPNVIFQIAKCVDLILTLNFEEFSASYEWLFVIDTMNCIYKSEPYISLADEISDCKDFTKSEASEFDVVEYSEFRNPLLQGIHTIREHSQLRKFFHTVSYAHYEEMYSLKALDKKACCDDLFADVFAFIKD
ncbi:LAME_0G07602g1_1 [Lachancea meyersii CBS 8951]|uniref:LAME_0G07602g1_1 n=1 Tax=Lachancea meyersii CBS 8951 TaxID=1266667 RepID=A0A1G4K7Z1_9SACH|nr:LAME_0G07602g1_1 [Lachancea meyersii CBS 8951]